MAASTQKMRNIGPKSAAWLRQVGLRTLDEIAAIGTVEAFMKVRRAGFKPSLNLLYALEGAVLDCHWQEVSGCAPHRACQCRRGRHRAAATAAWAASGRAGDHHDH